MSAVSGDEYRNSWLGLLIRKPDGFNFANLDKTYPDPTILQMERDGVRATIALSEAVANPDLATRRALDDVVAGVAARSVTLDGRPAAGMSSDRAARLISREGQSLWMLTVEGEDAARILDQITGGWKWISPE